MVRPDERAPAPAAPELAAVRAYAPLLELAVDQLGRTPSDTHVAFYRAFALRRLGRINEAEPVLRAALKEADQGDLLGLRSELALTLAQTNRREEAHWLMEAVERTDAVWGEYLHACMEILAGDQAAAVAHLHSVLSLDPTYHRDIEWERRILEQTREFGIGAQFGGKYFCHDIRVIRLPRHGASNPVALAVSCSADRQARGKITAEGVFLERLETDPARFLPEAADDELSDEVVAVDLDQPMDAIRDQLSRHPVKTRLRLSGTLVVGRDIAHAKIKERLDAGEPMPRYLRDHAIYYAGPAKTPEGYASGSFGPTTAGRMDSYVEQFQAAGGSFVMLAKGNRSAQVTASCAAHGGFYLGSIGGPAARLAKDSIRSVEVLEFPELGMEAVWKIEVEDFPAFIVVDDKGNDFYAEVTTPVRLRG